MITLEIPWEPVPWAAPRLSRYGCYDPREKDKRAIRACIKGQYTGPMIEGTVFLKFFFTFTPPPSASKKKKIEMLQNITLPTKCDCTNLQKLYEDCAKGIVFKDDRNVEMVFSRKLYGTSPSVIIKIYDLNEIAKFLTDSLMPLKS